MQIVLRLSRLDPEDPEGKRRRHYEISIDSPFTVLNCRATQANTALPRYTRPDVNSGYYQHTSCGCPDADVLGSEPSPASSTGTLPLVETDALSSSGSSTSGDTTNQALPTAPQAAYLASAPATSATPPGAASNARRNPNPIQRVRDEEEYQSPRPIHLLRIPSYDPPAFDADNPPPPGDTVMTPPPNYDAIVGTPSVDGLADYFARLADYDDDHPDGLAGGDDDSDSDEDHTPARILSRTGRVNIANPRTPGAWRAPSRSLEIERPFVSLSMPRVPRREGTDAQI